MSDLTPTGPKAPEPPVVAEVVELYPETYDLSLLEWPGGRYAAIEWIHGQPEFQRLVVQLHKKGPDIVGYLISELITDGCIASADTEDTFSELYDQPLKVWLNYFLDKARRASR